MTQFETRPEFPACPTQLWTQAQSSWPTVDLNVVVFTTHVQSISGSPSGAPIVWTRLNIADLYLACACLNQIPTAIGEFEHHVLPRTRSALHSMRLSQASVQDLLQDLRCKLLVPTDTCPAKIGTYAGRSRLDRWVRTAAVRMAINVVQRTQPIHRVTDLLGEEDHEQIVATHLSDHYRPLFHQSLTQALQALLPSHRNLLRLRFFEGMSLVELARAHNVHRATIVRRIAIAQADLLDVTRSLLAESLSLDMAGADSIIRIVQNKADFSMERLLSH